MTINDLANYLNSLLEEHPEYSEIGIYEDTDYDLDELSGDIPEYFILDLDEDYENGGKLIYRSVQSRY